MRCSRRSRYFWFLVVAVMFTGCGEDDGNPADPAGGGNVPASSLPFPVSPDQMMENFQTIYRNRDSGEYALLLAPGFEAILQQGTQTEFPLVGPTLDENEENRIHGRMFSGDDLTDANGDFLPGIVSFEFSVFSKIVDWGLSLPTDPIPETLSALYEVDLTIDRGQQFAPMRVTGRILFYAVAAEGRRNGQPATYYRMAGQYDLTAGGKETERFAWGSVKAMFY